MASNLPETKLGWLAVGKSGTGKSSLLRLLLDDPRIETSAATESKTRDIGFYKSRTDDTVVGIDTIGFDDSKKMEDATIRQKILDTCRKERITHLKVIICCMHEPRAGASVKKEMQFVESLDTKEHTMDKSVIILVREPARGTIKRRHSQPFVDAFQIALAEAGIVRERPVKFAHVWGYTCVDWLQDDPEDEPEDVPEDERLLQFTAGTVKQRLLGMLEATPPTQVVFLEYRCKRCPAKGDARGMKEMPCHPGFHAAHTGKHVPGPSPIPIHPQGVDWTHPSSGRVERYHLKGAGYFHPGHKKTTGRHVTFNYERRWTCCHAWYDNEDGCTRSWRCCGAENSPGCASKWSCCNRDGSTQGCKQLFQCCLKPPGAAGCQPNPDGVQYTYECCGGDMESPGCGQVCTSPRRCAPGSGGCDAAVDHDYELVEEK